MGDTLFLCSFFFVVLVMLVFAWRALHRFAGRKFYDDVEKAIGEYRVWAATEVKTAAEAKAAAEAEAEKSTAGSGSVGLVEVS